MGRAVQGDRLADPSSAPLPGFEPAAAVNSAERNIAMLQARVAERTARHPPRASSRATAACRTASMPASTAASARDDAPGKVAREPRPHGGGARRRAGSLYHRAIRSIRPTWWSPNSRGRTSDAAARRRHRDAHAGSRDRRLHRRLRAGAVRRCGRRGVIGAAHAGWRGALTGVIEATIAAMETARRRSATASSRRSAR